MASVLTAQTHDAEKSCKEAFYRCGVCVGLSIDTEWLQDAPVDAQELGLASTLQQEDAGWADCVQLVAQLQVVAAQRRLVCLCLPSQPKTARPPHIMSHPDELHAWRQSLR